jgi:hypothetical protein
MNSQLPREIEIERYISDVLSETYDISPFSVIYTECKGISIISITLFGQDDLKELLDLLGYKRLCDKTGFNVFRDKNTVILTQMAKDLLFSLLKKL